MIASERLKAASVKAAVAGGWDLANASFYGGPDYIGPFSVAAQEGAPTDVFFKPDGLKMYVVGSFGDSVYEYNLSTAWNTSTASYLQSFSVSAQENSPQSLFFKPDGLKMYVMGQGGFDVNEYNLSTAWDISTASYLRVFSVQAQEFQPQGLFFKPDGLKMYVIGIIGDDVNEYNLSTAWDVSTASYLQVFSVAAQESNPSGIFFKPDGLKMYVIGYGGRDVNEYDLSTAWDVSTASYLQVFSVALQESLPLGLFFSPDGLKMYVIGQSVVSVCYYDLGTAWDVSTAFVTLPTENIFSVSAREGSPQEVFFKPDGLKMYVIGSTRTVTEYDLSTAWDISTASYLQSFSVSSQESNPQGLFFKPDGLKMYVIGRTGDDVNEYNLSTAWDISTASYLQVFSIAAQESNPSGIFFNPDGLKMYVIGYSGDAVNEYNLSTAWDVSTASYLQGFSVVSQDTAPQGVFFRPDGLKMYVIGSNGDSVNEYDLSTAWDVSTALRLQAFSVSGYENFPTGIFFRPDGLKMYVIGTQNDTVYAYDL